MKAGTDGTLLGAWASVSNREKPLLILDVGTGTGLIALMMAQRFPEARVVGIDIDADAVLQAQENVAASPFADRVNILHQDFSSLTPQFSPLTPHPLSAIHRSSRSLFPVLTTSGRWRAMTKP